MTTFDLSSSLSSSVANKAVNSIGGTVPNSLCNLQTIQVFNFSGHHLNGTVPECFENLTEMEQIDFSGSQGMSGSIDFLCQMHKLTDVSFGVGSFDAQGLSPGNIPTCFGYKQALLTTVDLNGNKIGGSIPISLCNASMLQVLSLNGMQLSGSIPSCIGSNLKQLRELSLVKNGLSQSLPDTICNVTRLKSLSLNSNALTGQIPDCIGQLGHLLAWNMSSNLFTGHIPTTVCNATKLRYIYLADNKFTGPLPTCYDQLKDITELVLNDNNLDSTLPPELCRLRYKLLYLALNNNHLTGTIPSCYATDFKFIVTFYLQDNYLSGMLPDTWRLESLSTIILSNNKHLSGPLPTTIFSQVNTNYSLLPTLRSIVIEGTKVGGSISDTICTAPDLMAVALSGNRLTGSIPSCITKLTKLETLRVSDNSITGELPLNLERLSALQVLDLSSNQIGGVLPHGFGDLSPHMETTDLSLNYLSCDIPHSVLEWEKAPNFNRLGLLDGNLFACPDAPLGFPALAYSMPKSNGLYQSDTQTGAYRCGGSSYVFSGATVVVIALPISLMLMVKHLYGAYLKRQQQKRMLEEINEFDGMGRFSDSLYTESVRDSVATDGAMSNFKPSQDSNREWQLQQARQNMNRLAFSVAATGFIGGGMSLLIVLQGATSLYQCAYVEDSTMGSKDTHDRRFETSAGATIGVGVILATMLWWLRGLSFFGICASSLPPGIDDSDNKEAQLDSERDVTITDLKKTLSNTSSSAVSTGGSELDLDSEFMDGEGLLASGVHGESFNTLIDEEEFELGDVELDDHLLTENNESNKSKLTSFQHLKPPIRRLCDVTLQTLIIVAISIGPNIGYVVVITAQNIDTSEKDLTVLGITVLKVSLSIFLVSMVARRLVQIIYPQKLKQRFHLRLNISVMLAALTTVLIPLLVVLITDSRCYYFDYWQEKPETNHVTVTVCNKVSDVGSCSEWELSTVDSTYQPHVNFNGARCGSGVIRVYAPIFIAVVLLSATLPASIDLLVVPMFAPWAFKNRRTSRIAKRLFTLLLLTSNHTLPVLSFRDRGSITAINFYDQGLISPLRINVDKLSQKTVQRCFEQLLLNLLVALTFGLAAPYCGFACGIAAIIQWSHHREVLHNIVELAKTCDRSIGSTVRLSAPNRAVSTTSTFKTNTDSIMSNALPPDLSGCYSVPSGCCFICVATATVVWGGACHIYFHYLPLFKGFCLVIGGFISLYVVIVVAAVIIRRRKEKVHKLALKDPLSVQQPEWDNLDSSLLDNAYGGGGRDQVLEGNEEEDNAYSEEGGTMEGMFGVQDL